MKKTGQPLMNMKKTDDYGPPIFIISCERSGSTLLRYIIDTHPDICSPSELSLGSLCSSLIHLVDHLSLGEVGRNIFQEDRNILVCAEVNRMVSEWMNTYVKFRGKRLWCEKTPKNLDYLTILQSVFPDAKYICLHRNCMDVVYSLFEASRMGIYVDHVYYARNNNQVSVYVDSWVDKTSRLLTFEKENAQQCIRVRYEDIVTNPAETLKPVFEFIGVTWDEKLLDSVFSSPHENGYGDLKVMFTKEIKKASIGNGSAISSRQILDELPKKMNDLLARLDYPLVGEDWDLQAISPYIKAFIQRSEKENNGAATTTNDFFANFISQRLKANACRLVGINGVCKFVVAGDGIDSWVIDLNIPGGKIEAADREADCTIAIALKELMEMVNGDLNPGQALMQGKARVSGNIFLAREIGQILFGAEEEPAL